MEFQMFYLWNKSKIISWKESKMLSRDVVKWCPNDILCKQISTNDCSLK